MDTQNEPKTTDEKWDFEDYAFTIAGFTFALPMIAGIFIAAIDIGLDGIHRWWPFSWMSFMFAWSACTIKDVVDIKRGAEDKDLEYAAEYALYICMTTILLLIGIIVGRMQSSWLAGPVVFVLMTVIWPLLRNQEDKQKAYFPTIPFILLLAGVVVEVIVGGWIAFPISWILVSAVKMYKTIRGNSISEDLMVDIMYNAFTIILLATSLIWGSWVISWLAYPASVIVGKVYNKLRRNPA